MLWFYFHHKTENYERNSIIHSNLSLHSGQYSETVEQMGETDVPLLEQNK